MEMKVLKKAIPLVFLMAFVFCAKAQQRSAEKILSAEEAIDLLRQKFQVSVSYDKDLISAIPLSVDTASNDVSSVLKKLNENSGLIFEKLGPKNIIIKPRDEQVNYRISGSLVDAKTLEPLYSAIIFTRKSGFHTSCNEDGSFYKLVKYTSGDTVAVFLMGYEPVAIPIDRFAEAGGLKISMTSKLKEISEVSVTAYLTSGIDYDAMDNSITIRQRNRSILPGQANGDILLSLDALPGISSIDSKAGNLNIRGSTPDQTLITMDDIPLYQKGHLFGTISPFNANVVDNIKVQRSIMSANKGGRVGGSIEISTPESVTNKLNATVSASMMDASAYMHVPLVKNKLSFFVSARKSWPYGWNSPSMKPISDFVFQHTEISGAMKNGSDGITQLELGYSDANAKLIYTMSEKHKMTISGLYNNDNMSLGIRDNFQGANKNATLNTGNNGAGISLSSAWRTDFTTKLSFTASTYDQEFNSRTSSFSNAAVTDSKFSNKVRDYRSSLSAGWNINKRYQLNTGYDMHYYYTGYTKQTDDTANTSLKQDYAKNSGIHTVYTNLMANPVDRLFVNAGLRFNYFELGNSYSVEPRLSLGYKLTKTFRLKSSAGYQKQFITQISGVSIEGIGGIENLLWLLADDKNVPVVNSYQATFGGICEKNSWLIDVEGYAKNVMNVSSISINNPLGLNPYIHGNIEVYGADMLVRKQWRKLDAWVSYTLSKSTMKFDSVQATSFYSLFDQTHILDIAASYRWKQLKFSLAWKYRTGLAALSGIRIKMLHGANSAPGASATPPPPPPPPPGGGGPPPANPGEQRYTDRYPAYHTLDASVQYDFPRQQKKWRGATGVSVLNCYNQRNIIDQSMIFDKGKPSLQSTVMMRVMVNVFVTFSI